MKKLMLLVVVAAAMSFAACQGEKKSDAPAQVEQKDANAPEDTTKVKEGEAAPEAKVGEAAKTDEKTAPAEDKAEAAKAK